MSAVRKLIFGKVGKAIGDFGLIQEGDRIAVGLSGGKDSSTLLYVLAGLQKYSPVKFHLQGIFLDLGFTEEIDSSPLQEFCSTLEVPLHIERTSIGKILFTERQETNPCSLCSKMRNGALHNIGKSYGCNKVALGHHLDDAIESLLLSMFYEGRIRSFLPITYLDRKDITMIRPMVYVKEEWIRQGLQEFGIPVLNNPCPVNGATKRQEVKEIIAYLEKINPDIKNKLLSSLGNIETENLWGKFKD
jgi:tRNA(Ile)-lysidine synthase TilS/MesJ